MTLDFKVRLLVWSHYVLGLAQFLLGWLGLYFIDVGWPMFVNPEASADGTSGLFSPDFIGLCWIVFGVVFIIGGPIHSILTLLSAVFITRRIYRGFSLTVAGINATMVPIGPVISYYCFILLNDSLIKSQYQARSGRATKPVST